MRISMRPATHVGAELHRVAHPHTVTDTHTFGIGPWQNLEEPSLGGGDVSDQELAEVEVVADVGVRQIVVLHAAWQSRNGRPVVRGG